MNNVDDASFPLILHQYAARRNQEYLRVHKDGRISLFGMKKNSHNQVELSHEKDGREKSPIELQVSKPWKTY